MTLRQAKGNLLDMAMNGDFDVIVHGCNCQGVMGSGIAKEIKDRFPEAYQVYRQEFNRLAYETDFLGNYTFAHVIRELPSSNLARFNIVNAFTQVNYLPRNIDHFEYESFALILRKLAARFKGSNFGFPYIGMGLAGGDAHRIKVMLAGWALEVEAGGGTVTLVEFAP